MPVRRPGPGVTGVIVLTLGLLLLAFLAATKTVDPGLAASLGAILVAAGFGFLAGGRRPERRVEAGTPNLPIVAVPQEFLERIPDPVILLNGVRQIVAVNAPAREVLGIGLLGRDLSLSLRHPDVLAAVETLGLGIPTLTEEVTLPGPVPRTFMLHAGTLHLGEPPEAAGPGAPRAVLILRDETRAKRAEQSRADFVANASHELRSPLSALIGFIETLRGPASDDGPARKRFLGVMQAEAQRMARLVDDLMSLSRVEINEHVPPRHRVHLADVLAAVAETLEVRADARQMTIDVDCPEDLPAVPGENDQLTQVFHNLVANAVQYARAGTAIRITARLVDSSPGVRAPELSVAVADQGDGIEAIHLPRLTERFYRADEGRSRRMGGTGLGLAIVKHIINRHRGRLTIESRVGSGSTFTVFLPATPHSSGGGQGPAGSAGTAPAVPEAVIVIKP